MFTTISQGFILWPEVVHPTGVSRATVYQKMVDKTFPRQISIGSNLVVVLEKDIKNWIQEKANQIKVLPLLSLLMNVSYSVIVMLG
ncbi:AlpA family phage regulatory protein [Prochlorococcus sp. MIT 0601]|uniref:helix-turn-helix transcriptional regulator n=2 Tax=Prochlorococcus TaxID=1218 RepID=UPI00068CACD1|nr:AlpA family phage regulatory protein [Prochlorococcus sp. MIT 0601]